MADFTETAQKTYRLPSELIEATEDLAQQISQSKPILCYQKANQELVRDQEAIQILQAATELQNNLRSGKFSVDNMQGDIERLRVLQNEMITNTVIQEQAESREIAVAFLQGVNQEISQLLGFDFASLTRRSSGCC